MLENPVSENPLPLTILAITCCGILLSQGLPRVPEQPAPITFSDVTAAAGITFRHVAGPTKQKYLPEAMGSGVAIFDFDGDGRQDLFFVNGVELPDPMPPGQAPRKKSPRESHRLYRNLGNWQFQDVTEKWGIAGQGYGMGVAVGDYDNDSKPDVYITSFGRNYLYRNTGTRFIEVAEEGGVQAGGWSAGAAFLDFDRDGKLDIFVSRYLNWSFEKSRWCGEGEGAPRSYCHPRYFRAVSHLLFHNNGDGTFQDVSVDTGIARSSGKGLGVKVEDVNDDGWPDILVANDSVAQQLFVNHGGKRFEESALRHGLAYDEDGNTYAGMGIDAADVDGDGRAEVFVNALARQGYWLYKRKESGPFTAVSSSSGLASITGMRSGWGARLADFDNDGWPDLMVAQGHVMDTIEWNDPAVRYLEPPLLARNLFGRFFDVAAEAGPAFSRPRAGRGLAVGDLDGDGLLDVVISNNNGAPSLLRNTTATGNHWLALRLQGSGSNRDGFGSRIVVTTASGRRLYAYADTSGSYLSASSSRIHVGLGADESAVKVEILWPTGTRCTWSGEASNRVLDLDERCASRKSIGSQPGIDTVER